MNQPTNNKEKRYKEINSKRGLSVITLDGEPITVKINEKGVIILTSNLSPNYGGIGSFEVTGLDPQEAASKKKSFWGRLWQKIKAAASDLLDAVTVPLFGYRCRPDIKVNINSREVLFGVSCTEA